MTRKWMLGSVLLAAVLAVAATGCSDDDDDDTDTNSGGDATSAATSDSEGGATEQLCNDLDDLATAIEGVQDLNADSTVEDAQAAFEAVDTAWSDLESAAGAVAQSEASALGTSIEDLGDTIQNVSSADTLADAESEVQAAAADVADAREELATGADCS